MKLEHPARQNDPQPLPDPSPDADTSSRPQATYEQRRAEFAAQRDAYLQRSRRQANVTLALAVAALLVIGIGIWQRSTLVLGAALLLGLGCIASFVYHGRIDRRQRRFAELWAINDEGLRRLMRDWETLPLRQPPAPPDDPTAIDLDLLGHASLQHLLNTAYTPVGQATLQNWLLHPAAPEVVAARQAAVAELAPLIALREELALHGRPMSDAQTNYELFLRWAESEPWFIQRRWLVVLTWLLPLLLIAALAAQMAGLISYSLWLPLVVINLALVLTIGGRADETIDQVVARQSVFRAYADLFGVIAAQPFRSPDLQRLQRALTAGNVSAAEQMRRLGRLMPLADFRMFMFYLPVNIATLWSFHVLWLLERWQRHAGSQARSWLAAFGEIEALAALATLAHDHPAWAFPTFVIDGPQLLTARKLGHPLLPPAARMDNDVLIGPPGTLLLVTGSNMSGKSTLMRAIGVNVALAQAGGPVCAAELRLPPLVLATSMRVQDSLEHGVSYFMAELLRLKAIVDLAQEVHAAGDRTLLFLLDEILHGTNTSERRIAARQIIGHLLALHAMGAVSTHDLTLADSPEIAAVSRPVYFTESFSRGPDGPIMEFDYTLRPGIAPSTNALKLMEIVGLPLDGAAGPID